ncbi:TetR/AcrR family transcriptional regulator [Enterococcus eurekensis]|uniref:TetR/AcrR family transcriptional regulator n=1 Tax=Enterococcus eurekensis TaxID=1159753 RepID=A0ABV9M5Q3_9ENTE
MYDAILDVAEKLFMSQGYNETSTRQITEQLNISQPALYYHFKNKEEIYFNVMVRLSREVERSLRDLSAKENLTLEEKIGEMALFLQRKHPVNLILMLRDIRQMLSEEISYKIFMLWKISYKQPFIDVFSQSPEIKRVNESLDWIVGQLFVVISTYLETTDKEEELLKSIHLFLYGVMDE